MVKYCIFIEFKEKHNYLISYCCYLCCWLLSFCSTRLLYWNYRVCQFTEKSTFKNCEHELLQTV